MKSRSHTFVRFGTAQANSIELLFETFYKDFYQAFIKIYFKSDGVFNF